MAELHYDEKATKRLLAAYVTPDVVEQRRHFLGVLNPHAGERILDVGSGPGYLAAEIGERTGDTGSVHGVDISEPLMAVARAHCTHLPWVTFQNASATKLPFGDDEFDAAVSVQVLEYVRDVDLALAEMHRVLRPGGRVVLVDTDWDSIVWHTSDPGLMNQVLSAWEEHATDPRLPRTLENRLRVAGFSVDGSEVVPLFNPSFDANTYSNRIIDLIESFVVAAGLVDEGAAEAWANELRESGLRGEYFFSLNRYVFWARKP